MSSNVTGYYEVPEATSTRKNVAVVGGFAAGKTTLSDGLVQQGWTRVSFAKYLKDIAAYVYGNGLNISKDEHFTLRNMDGTTRMASGRTILQELGQTVKAMDRDFWIRVLQSDIYNGLYGTGPYVIDDCRFPYEADALKDMDFIIVKLDTPLDTRIRRYFQTYGIYPTPAELVHPSEIELVDIVADYIIDGEKEPKAILAEVYALAK